ncbi:hypothetical protein D3C87_1338220 [compost metagenome]
MGLTAAAFMPPLVTRSPGYLTITGYSFPLITKFKFAVKMELGERGFPAPRRLDPKQELCNVIVTTSLPDRETIPEAGAAAAVSPELVAFTAIGKSRSCACAIEPAIKTDIRIFMASPSLQVTEITNVTIFYSSP